MRVEWNLWWFSITLGSIRVVWSHDSTHGVGGKPKPNSWDAATKYHLVLEGLENRKMFFLHWGNHVFCTLGVAWSLLKQDVYMDLTYMMCCYVEFCPTLLSGWSLPRLDQGIAEAKAKSDPSRLEPWVFKKKVIASGHFHLLPLLTSIHHIHRYSFSAVFKHSKVFFFG